MGNRKLYLAYGSNLNLEQMSYRCRDAEVVAKTEIPGYRMMFCGSPHTSVATIEPAEGCSVPVLLWEISPRDERRLDQYEGWPSFYEKQNFTVSTPNGDVDAMAYVMTPGHFYGTPSREYLKTIRQGYEENGFDVQTLNTAVGESVLRWGEPQCFDLEQYGDDPDEDETNGQQSMDL